MQVCLSPETGEASELGRKPVGPSHVSKETTDDSVKL